MKLFLCSSSISLGRYCQKSLTKGGGFRKKIKRRDGHIVGVGVGGVYRRGIETFCILCTKIFQNKTLWQIMDLRLNNSRPNWAHINLLLEKRIFWENEYCFGLPIVLHYATMSQKNTLIVGQIMKYKILLFVAKLNTNHPFVLAVEFLWKIKWC